MKSLLQGFLMGIAYAAPIGAQNIYVIKSAIGFPLKYSLRVAFIVAMADVILGMACFWGVGSLLTSTKWLSFLVEMIGSVFLAYMGLRLFIDSPGDVSLEGGQRKAIDWWSVVSSAMALTWFNPQAIIDGSLILGGFRAQLMASDFLFFAVGMSFASFFWFHSVVLIVGHY